MLFAKMLRELDDSGLLLKAKKRSKEDEAKREQFKRRDAKNGRELTNMMERLWFKEMHEDKKSEEDILDDMVYLLNNRFAESIKHDPDSVDEDGIEHDEMPLVTPAQSKWLQSKYKELVEEKGKGFKDRMVDFEDLQPTTQRNSIAYHLGMLPSSIREDPQRAIDDLLFDESPLGAAWYGFLEQAINDNRFQLDEKAMQDFIASREEADRQRTLTQADAERGFGEDFDDEGEPTREFGSMEEEAQRSKEGYDKLFSRYNIRPRREDQDKDSTSLKPIGFYSDMASNIADTLEESINNPITKKIRNRDTGVEEEKTFPGGMMQYLYETYHQEREIESHNEMQARHTQQLDDAQKEGIEGDELEALKNQFSQETEEYHNMNQQLRSRLRSVALNEKFNSIQNNVNEHARDALQIKNIGMRGGKKGSAPNIVTPAMKQIAQLLKLQCGRVNAPDVMSEPMKALLGQDVARATGEAYQRKLGQTLIADLNDTKPPYKAHSAIMNSASQGGHLSRAFPELSFGDARGGGGGLSRQTTTGDAGYAGEARGGSVGEGGDFMTDDDGDDVGISGEAATEQSSETAGRVDDSSALGEATSLPQSPKEISDAAAYVRGKYGKNQADDNEQAKKYRNAQWFRHAESLKAKVKRGEMSSARASRELSRTYYDEHNFNEAHGYAIHSMDQIPEVHDPSHPLYGRNAEERVKYAERLLDAVMGTQGVIMALNAQQDLKAEQGDAWAHNDAYRVHSIDELKSLMRAPVLDEGDEGERTEEEEARMAQQQFAGRFLEQSHTLQAKFEGLGVDYGDVLNELIRSVQQRASLAQTRQKDDEEPLSDSAAFQQAFMNIMTGAGAKAMSVQVGEDEQREMREKIDKLTEELDSHYQMREYSEGTDEANDLARAKKRERDKLKQELSRAMSSGGSKSALPFARSIFYALKNKIDAREVDDKYLNKTREQTNELMTGRVENKRDCAACVGSKDHFVNEDAKSAYNNSHERIKNARGGKSPFVYMKVKVPDLTYLFREGSPKTANLQSVAEYLGLDWKTLDNYEDDSIRSILYEAIVDKQSKGKDVAKHFSLSTRAQNLLPVGAAKMNTAQLTLMAKLFPDDYNAFRARDEEDNILTAQRQSITGALNLYNDLQEEGFKMKGTNIRPDQPLKYGEKMRLVEAIMGSRGGREVSELEHQKGIIAQNREALGKKHNAFFADETNSKLFAQYTDAQNELETLDPAIFPKERARIEDEIKRLGRDVRIPEKSKLKNGSKLLGKIHDAYKENDKLQRANKKAMVTARENVKDVDQNAVGALVAMWEDIVPYHERANKDAFTNKGNEDLIEMLMDKHYTQADGQMSRSVYSAGVKPPVTGPKGLNEQENKTRRYDKTGTDVPYRYGDKFVLRQQRLGAERQWTTAAGKALRHGGDRAFGSIFNANSGVFAIPHIESISEIPAILKMMEEKGWKKAQEDDAQTETDEQTEEYMSKLFGSPAKGKSKTNESGLMSEEDARKRNHSDMSINADKRNNDNRLGTASHCGFCRGHGAVPIERLANYFATHNKDLRHLDQNDEEMAHYITQHGRPADTPSFDHHREQFGDDAWDDHEHATYACPDCQHEDSSVEGGFCSDGLCNHCLGRGEIDPQDTDRMKVLFNERLKHPFHHGDHATLEQIGRAMSRIPYVHDALSATVKDITGIRTLQEGATGVEGDGERETGQQFTAGRKRDDNKNLKALLKTFPDPNNKALMPLEMMFDSAHNGAFPDVLSPAQLQDARKKRIEAEQKRGHLKSLRADRDAQRARDDEMGYQTAVHEEGDPMREAMRYVPSNAARELQNGTHRTVLKSLLANMQDKLIDADDDTKEKAQDYIDEIMEGVHIDLKHDSNFTLGGSSAWSSKSDRDGKSLNFMFSRLQNLVNKHHKEQNIAPSQTVSNIESGGDSNVKNLFDKKNHSFNNPLLHYHKGRMMTAAEMKMYDDHEGFNAHAVSPHAIERWFARNSNPASVKSMQKKWKEMLLGKKGVMATKKGGPPGKFGPGEKLGNIYRDHPDEDPVMFAGKSDIVSAFLRQGPSAQKAHKHDNKRAMQFMERLDEMREGGVPAPIMNSIKSLPVGQEYQQLLKEVPGMKQEEEDFTGMELHDSLSDFSDEAQKWLMPTIPARLEDGSIDYDAYHEPIEGEVPYHRELESKIDTHLDKEFENYLMMKALKHFVKANAESEKPLSYPSKGEPGVPHLSQSEPLTFAKLNEIFRPNEQGGDAKQMKIIKKAAQDLIDGGKGKGANNKTIYRIGGESISPHEYKETRVAQLQEKGTEPVSMFAGKSGGDNYNGLANMVNYYFKNYDKNPVIERDKQLVKFGAQMFKTHFYPNLAFETMCERNGIKTKSDLENALNDPTFAEEYATTTALISSQHPNWSPIPANVREHMDDLAHVDGLKKDTYVPKYGTASNPLSQPSPLADNTPRFEQPRMATETGTRINPPMPDFGDIQRIAGVSADDYDFAEENRPADLGAPTPGGEGTPIQQGPPMVEQPNARFDSDRPQGGFGIPAVTPPYAPQPDENNS